MSPPNTKAALLFSGGTDSTCAAALLAEKFSELHLLTFYEHGTRHSPLPAANVELLRKRFPGTTFIQKSYSTDQLVKKLSYHRYLANIWRHGFFVLSTPGFSSLSWHTTMVEYCRRERIFHVADGLTRELMHFPGHMEEVIELFRVQYQEFGITYENPVRDWQVPPDQQLIDRLIVDRHGFFIEPGLPPAQRKKTTGAHLHSLGIFPSENIKGSRLDQGMQHDCYPFVLYNILVFWLYLPFRSMAKLEARVTGIMMEKTALCTNWLRKKEVVLEP